MTASSRMIDRMAVLVLLCTVLFAVSPGELRAAEYIGFASMEVPVVKDPLMRVRFKELTSILYSLKYSSFQQVAAKKQLTELRPKTLEIRYDGGKVAKLNPSKKNTKAIAFFHESFGSEFEEYLLQVCALNEARAIVFDRSEDPEILRSKNFGKDPDAALMVMLHAFYRDSNTMEVDFIDINKALMANFPRLKTVVQGKVVEIAEKVIGNQAAFAGAGSSAFDNPDDSAVPGDAVVAAPADSEW